MSDGLPAELLWSSMAFDWRSMDVLLMPHVCSIDVLWCSMDVLRFFYGCSIGVLWILYGCSVDFLWTVYGGSIGFQLIVC